MRLFTHMATIVSLLIMGCTGNHSQSITTAVGEPMKQPGDSVRASLPRELRRFGCELKATDFRIGSSVAWRLDRDRDGALVWIEGDHTLEILKVLRTEFGEPAFLNESDSNGFLSFSYRKDQCGVAITCGIDPRSGWGLKGPLTCVGIHTKIAKLL